MSNDNTVGYQFFICYTRDSAEDLAIHLWNSLKKRGISAFLDLMNIPKKTKKIEWRKYRDEALCNSETMLLIITHGFEKSEEVKKEMSLAFDEEKDFLLLRHKELDKNVAIVLKDEKINLGDYNQIMFHTKEELLRNVLSACEKEKVKKTHISLSKKEDIENKDDLSSLNTQERVSFGKHKRIVYCSRCGAIPGQQSTCTGTYTHHNFVTGTDTIYCSRCGTKPGQQSTCTGTYTHHNFVSDY